MSILPLKTRTESQHQPIEQNDIPENLKQISCKVNEQNYSKQLRRMLIQDQTQLIFSTQQNSLSGRHQNLTDQISFRHNGNFSFRTKLLNDSNIYQSSKEDSQNESNRISNRAQKGGIGLEEEQSNYCGGQLSVSQSHFDQTQKQFMQLETDIPISFNTNNEIKNNTQVSWSNSNTLPQISNNLQLRSQLQQQQQQKQQLEQNISPPRKQSLQWASGPTIVIGPVTTAVLLKNPLLRQHSQEVNSSRRNSQSCNHSFRGNLQKKQSSIPEIPSSLIDRNLESFSISSSEEEEQYNQFLQRKKLPNSYRKSISDVTETLQALNDKHIDSKFPLIQQKQNQKSKESILYTQLRENNQKSALELPQIIDRKISYSPFLQIRVFKSLNQPQKHQFDFLKIIISDKIIDIKQNVNSCENLFQNRSKEKQSAIQTSIRPFRGHLNFVKSLIKSSYDTDQDFKGDEKSNTNKIPEKNSNAPPTFRLDKENIVYSAVQDAHVVSIIQSPVSKQKTVQQNRTDILKNINSIDSTQFQENLLSTQGIRQSQQNPNQDYKLIQDLIILKQSFAVNAQEAQQKDEISIIQQLQKVQPHSFSPKKPILLEQNQIEIVKRNEVETNEKKQILEIQKIDSEKSGKALNSFISSRSQTSSTRRSITSVNEVHPSILKERKNLQEFSSLQNSSIFTQPNLSKAQLKSGSNSQSQLSGIIRSTKRRSNNSILSTNGKIITRSSTIQIDTPKLEESQKKQSTTDILDQALAKIGETQESKLISQQLDNEIVRLNQLSSKSKFAREEQLRIQDELIKYSLQVSLLKNKNIFLILFYLFWQIQIKKRKQVDIVIENENEYQI